MVRWYFLLLFICGAHSLCSQNLSQVSAITIEDGLRFRAVNAIAQDSRGLLWIGTDQGIDYYDGYRFIHFAKDKSANFYFPGSNVIDDGILMLNDTIVWAVVDNLLYALNSRNFAYEQLDIIPGEIHQIRAGKDDMVWFATQTATEEQLWCYHPQRGMKKINTIPKALAGYTYLQIDTVGNAWWSTIHEGLRCISPKGEILHKVILDSIVEFDKLMHFTPLRIDRQNRIYICPRSRSEVWQYFPAADSVAVVAAGLPSISYCTYEDKSGNCWFGTKSSVVRINPDQEVSSFEKSLNRVLDFSNVTTFYQDQSDVLWIGTNGGLLRMPQTQNLFDLFLESDQIGKGNEMRGICEDNEGNLYTYCENGVYGMHRIEKATGKTTLLTLQDTAIDKFNLLDRTNHIFYDQRYNCLWSFTKDLQQIKLTSPQSIRKVRFPAGVSYNSNPKVLYQCPDGRLLLAAQAGELRYYNPAEDTWATIPNTLPDSLAKATVKAIATQGKDSLWVGTINHGLLLISGTDGRLLRHYSTASAMSLENNHVLSLYHDSVKGLLWIGTFGGGLHQMNLETEKIDVYNEASGLPNNNVVSILPAKDYLWVATYNGLSAFNYNTKSFRNFFVEDGLSNNEFNYSSSFIGSDGTIYLGGLNGINGFNPEELLQDQRGSPLRWMGFQQYSHQSDSLYKFHILSHTLDTPMVIEPSISYFELEWTLPDYVRPDKNQYYTLMEGINRDWVYQANQPFIRFNGLPAGQYRLRVKGRDSKGNWSTSELNIPILVKAPIWQRWYSIAGAVLVSIGLVYLIARYRFQQKLRMEQIRTRIASDLHDEVGSMLSGLAMQAEILELQHPISDPSALEYLKNVSRQAVGKMRDLVWSIDSRRDYMHNLVDRMREFAEEAFYLAGKDFEFTSKDLPLQRKLAVDTRQHIYLIFREAVTNICKHSNADHVHIFFGRRAGRLELRIQDNGTIAPKENRSTGLGLDNMYGRAQALKGELTIEYKNGFVVLLII